MSRKVPVKTTVIGLLTLLCGVLFAGAVWAETYQPMFDQAYLQSLDPATRQRFAQLEAENRKRWENKHPTSARPDQARAEAEKYHAETKHALRRIEESRRLKQRANAMAQHQAKLVSEHKQRCKFLANEIKQLRAGGPLYEVAKDGSRQYLTEQELKKRVKSGEKRYKEGCTG